MIKKDSNNISSHQNNTISLPPTVVIILYSTLIFFGVVLLIYFNLIIGGLLIIGPAIHKFLNKFITVKPIDDWFKKIFNTNKSVIILCGIIFLIGLGIIVINETNLLANKGSHYPTVLGGIVWDENTDPFPSVIVFLPEIGLIDTTDKSGRYLFEINDPSHKSLTLIAQKEGYITLETEVSVGNTAQNFKLKRK